MEGVEDDDPLLSIGVFARRARLSPKALRVYDRQGLLPPDRVDAVTGYRYYRGGVVAVPFVVYHGQVNDDSDGPVEVCVPIDPARAAVTEVTTAVRTEPAHREVYTTLTKAQVEYPQILSAYDAVYRWVEENDGREAGPGREVYFADWMSAGSATEVCDIAVPVA
ncbi:MerR family transcriptional regulator [Streptomyces rectiverticillatus]|uniref:MerR family transcriptional regulator n=1 Tax=Streptomyces rectiverticillatus TaxID=173860 RepID=UPI003CCD56AB